MNQTDPCDVQIFSIAHAAQQRAVKNRQRRLRGKHRASQPKAAKSIRSPRQAKGDAFEARACQYLEQEGLTVLARQLACPRGEIDLVLRHGHTLVFVEVRARAHASHGGAAASITAHKQSRLIHTAKWYLSALSNRFFAGSTPACRIDVITFDLGHLQWLQDAIRLEQDK
jgi:putative endonuclease